MGKQKFLIKDVKSRYVEIFKSNGASWNTGQAKLHILFVSSKSAFTTFDLRKNQTLGGCFLFVWSFPGKFSSKFRLFCIYVLGFHKFLGYRLGKLMIIGLSVSMIGTWLKSCSLHVFWEILFKSFVGRFTQRIRSTLGHHVSKWLITLLFASEDSSFA